MQSIKNKFGWNLTHNLKTDHKGLFNPKPANEPKRDYSKLLNKKCRVKKLKGARPNCKYFLDGMVCKYDDIENRINEHKRITKAMKATMRAKNPNGFSCYFCLDGVWFKRNGTTPANAVNSVEKVIPIRYVGGLRKDQVKITNNETGEVVPSYIW